MDQPIQTDSSGQALQKILYKESNTGCNTTVYGVFDGAAIEDLWVKLDRWDISHASLFEDEELDITKTVSPYVVELQNDHEGTQALLNEFGNNTGIYLQSPMTLAELQDHLKGFFRILTVNNQPALFRFYSPSVFRQYVIKADGDYHAQFFDKIDAYFAEDLDKEILIQYHWNKEKIVTLVHPIKEEDTNKLEKQSGAA